MSEAVESASVSLLGCPVGKKPPLGIGANGVFSPVPAFFDGSYPVNSRMRLEEDSDFFNVPGDSWEFALEGFGERGIVEFGEFEEDFW